MSNYITLGAFIVVICSLVFVTYDVHKSSKDFKWLTNKYISTKDELTKAQAKIREMEKHFQN